MKLCTLQTEIIDCPDLSTRTKGALYRGGLKTIQDIINLEPENILNIRNIGPGALAEVEALLVKFEIHQNEYVHLEEARSILKNVTAREASRSIQDQHFTSETSKVVLDIIDMLEKVLDYNK